MEGRGERRVPILVAAFVAGAQALLAQTLLLREELVLYGGNEVALGAFFGLWLLGIVAGALAVRRLGERAGGVAAPVLLAQPVLLLLAAWAARAARGLSGIPPYEPFPLSALLLWSVPIAVPVSLATGASVPALAARARRASGSVTAIYVTESLGSFAGGAGTSLMLAVGLDPGVLLLACGALGAWGGSVLERGTRRLGFAALGLALALATPAAGPGLGRILRVQQLATVLPGATLLDHAETASASLMLAALDRQQVLLSDGRVLAAFPDAERVERAGGALAAVGGGPRRVLVVGPEAVDLMPGLLALGALDRVVWLVPDPGFRRFALRHVPGLAGDPRLEILVGDPVRLRADLASRGPYDGIWVLVDTPMRRADDRFLALETLRALAEMLVADGTMAVPVRSAENYVGPRLRLAVGTVVSGMKEALGAVRLVPGEDTLVLGARESRLLNLDPSHLHRLYRAMQPTTLRIDPEGFESLLEPRRVELADQLLASLLADRNVQPSRVDRPLALFHNLIVRAEQEDPDLARTVEALRDRGGVLWIPLFVVGLFVLGTIAGKREISEARRASALVVLGTGGAIGMALDLTLLHMYQGRFGTLYLEAGWLFGLWMVGLAVGGMTCRRLCQRLGPMLPGLAAFVPLAMGAFFIAHHGGEAVPSRAVGAGAFALAGALTGTLVPVAEALLARSGVVGAGAGVAIEAADHLGGALSAVALGVFAIPIMGLSGTAWVIGGMGFFGALALVLPRAAAFVTQRLPPGWRRRLFPTTAQTYRSFPYRRTIWALLALCAATVAGNAAVRAFVAGPRIHLDAETLAITGLPPPWREAAEPVVHYRAGPEAESGVALASRAVAHMRGYGGPLNLLVAADRDGVIRRVAVLEHRETPSYMEQSVAFLESLGGKSLLEGFRLRVKGAPEVGSEPWEPAGGQRVDAMTGATVTSRAVVEALEEVGKRLAEPVFGRPYRADASPETRIDPRIVYLIVSLVLLLPVFWFGRLWMRRAWLVSQAAVGGVLLGVQFSTVQVLSLLRVEGDWNPLAWTGLLTLGVLILAALFGPVYCGYLCPAGAAQELFGAAGNLMGFTRTLPPSVDQRARFVKYLLLAVIVMGALGFGGGSVERLDLLRAVWNPNRSQAAVALLVMAGAGSLLAVRFGCRYLCPGGAFLNLANTVAPLRRFLPAKRYASCDLGVRAYPDVDCIQCNRCRVGERAEAARRPQTLATQTLLAVVLITLAAWALPFSPGREAATTVYAQVEPVDVNLLKFKISAGTLSDKPALYWRVVRP